MKNKLLTQMSVSAFLLTCSHAFAWDSAGGPAREELVRVENPSGVLAGNVISEGGHAGDVGVLATGSMGSTIYMADQSSGGKNIWLATENLSGGSSYRIYGGGDFSGADTRISLGQTRLQIGGDSTALALDRIYGGSNVSNGASVEQGSIYVDIYGNVSTGGIIAAAGQAWSGDNTESLGGIHVKGDVTLSMHGGTVDSPTEDFGDGVHVTSSGIYGGARVGSENKAQGSFVADGSVNVYLGGSLKLNANVFTGGEALNAGASILIKGGTNLVIDGATLTASEALVGGARATFITGTSSVGSVAEVAGGSKVVMNAGTVGESSNPYALTGIIGGGWASGAGKSVVDYSSVRMSGGSAYTDVYGGSYAQQSGKSVNGIEGDTSASKTLASVEISGGADIVGDVFAGSRHDNAINDYDSSSNIWGNTSAAISGGSMQDVYGGSIALNAQSYGKSVANIYGNTSVEISGGSMRDVFGGGYAEATVSGGTVESVVTGGTSVVVSGGSISGDIYGGGYGSSVVNGGADVTFLGRGGDIDFSGNVYGGGLGGGAVEGVKAFNFGNGTAAFSGDFNGTIIGFDTVKVNSGSNVNIRGGVTDSNIRVDGAVLAVSNANYSGIYDETGINEGWRPHSKIEAYNSSTLTVEDSNFAGNESVALNPPASGTGIAGLAIQANGSDLTVNRSVFSGNKSVAKAFEVQGVVYAAGGSNVKVSNSRFESNSAKADSIQGVGIALFDGSASIENTTFAGNSGELNPGNTNAAQGGAIYAWGQNSGWVDVSVKNSVFSQNSVGGYTAAGGAITMFAGSMDIDASTFSGNSAAASNDAIGGAIRFDTWNAAKPMVLTVSNSVFENNTVKSGDNSRGGAIHVYSAAGYTASAVITDTVFTGNSSVTTDTRRDYVGGGAIYVNDADVTIRATKSMTYLGNSAVVNGFYDDSFGGFMMLRKISGTSMTPSAAFDVADGAVLTVGNGAKGYDSIASNTSEALISKSGLGALVVNSSMRHYKGALSVAAGEMTVNNALGASEISISSGATLGVKISGAGMLSASSLAFDSSGTLKLVAAEGLGEGSYAVSADSAYLNGSKSLNGSVKTYGGTFDAATNSFVVAAAEKVVIGDAAQPKASVAQNGRVELFSADVSEAPAVVMNFSSSQEYGINSVTDMASDTGFVEAVSSIGEDAIVSGAYDFNLDAAIAGGDSVVLSFYVGSRSLSAGMFKIFHQDADGGWSLAEDVEGVAYDGAYLNFEVSHFSSYGFAAVPEPAVFAALLGIFSLFAASARRRRRE